MELEVRALRRTKLAVEQDLESGGVSLTGELDFDVVPSARAEIAVRLLTATARTVDLSGLTDLTGPAVVLIEELLEDGVAIRCAAGCAAEETLRVAGLTERVEVIVPPRPRNAEPGEL
ncbi:hypothetical protein [Nocardioides nematodiphilus]|uniref:hypothetical protein n=1 Tax=Nocardioides nematodiphilus TaxID=2849669 RepID=UPI001CD9270B|nr:hypothetical protein [Nocardioides nematodiphilus]MCA1983095.1 hypothetical protein [Nocardioides nematodiphilus]